MIVLQATKKQAFNLPVFLGLKIIEMSTHAIDQIFVIFAFSVK